MSRQAYRNSRTILTLDWRRFRLSCTKSNAFASSNFRSRPVRLRFLKTAGAARWNLELKSSKIKAHLNVVESTETLQSENCKIQIENLCARIDYSSNLKFSVFNFPISIQF